MLACLFLILIDQGIVQNHARQFIWNVVEHILVQVVLYRPSDELSFVSCLLRQLLHFLLLCRPELCSCGLSAAYLTCDTELGNSGAVGTS